MLIGAGCFAINNLALWSAAIAPPAGYQPRWALSNLDIPIYLTWMTLAPSHWLMPNYHAPWASESALLSPLVWLAGQMSAVFGWSPRLGFQVFHLLLYLVAGASYAMLLYTFCSSRRQRIAAFILSVTALPLPLVALGWTNLVGKKIPLLVLGLVQFSYETADGLFRGGLSNSFTLTFGTAASLMGIVLLTRYVRMRERAVLAGLAVTAALSAFFHPVEMCVIVLASVLSFGLLGWREGAWMLRLREAMTVGLGGAVGLAPHLIQSARSEWVRDISRLYVWETSSVLWVPLVFGVPTILGVYFLLMRFRLTEPGDEVLRTWVVASVVLLWVPGVPLKLHIFDGFPYVMAVMVVRLLAGNKQMRGWAERQPRAPMIAFASLVILCVPGYYEMYSQIWRDARKPEPEFLLNAIERREEPELIAWLRTHAAPTGQLAMGPPEIAPWIATAPMPSLASHDLFGVTYEEQNKYLEQFYAGKLSGEQAEEGLRKYGVRYLLVPPGSAARRYVEGQTARTEIAGWAIYDYPERRRPVYPGLAKLRADVASKFGLGSLLSRR